MKNKYLTFEDRKRLEELYDNGERITDIAVKLGVHHTTIYRELSRCQTGILDKNGREIYTAEDAQAAFVASLKRRGHTKEPDIKE